MSNAPRHIVRSVKPGPKPKAHGAARGKPPQKVLRMPFPVLVCPPRPDCIWRPATCQYPHGDPREPGFHFCGAEIEVADGRPYCADHTKLCTLERPAGSGGDFKMFGWGGE